MFNMCVLLRNTHTVKTAEVNFMKTDGTLSEPQRPNLHPAHTHTHTRRISDQDEEALTFTSVIFPHRLQRDEDSGLTHTLLEIVRNYHTHTNS